MREPPTSDEAAYSAYHAKISTENGYIFKGLALSKTFDDVFAPFQEGAVPLSTTIVARLNRAVKNGDQPVVVDIGAADNTFLRELSEACPGIIALGISLADMRNSLQKDRDKEMKILYTTLPIEKAVKALRNVDLIVSTNTTAHIYEPLSSIIDTYNHLLSDKGDMYIEIQSNQRIGSLNWGNSENIPTPFLESLKKQGVTMEYTVDGGVTILHMYSRGAKKQITADFFTVRHEVRKDEGVVTTDTYYTLTES